MKIKVKFARAGTLLKDATTKFEELLEKLPGTWHFIFLIHYINSTVTTCIRYDYLIYLFVFMYLPELGCDVDMIQEWQKEEVEALIPREQGSSAFNLHEKEKHCFLFSLVSYFCCRINTAVGRVLPQPASHVQKTQVPVYVVWKYHVNS